MTRTMMWIARAMLAAALTWASSARADCAAPTGYWLTVTGNSVKVTLGNFQHRTCPDPDGLLRQNAATGEIVRLADFCGAGDASYIDECVPPGTYKYGLATPYTCEPSSCGTYYYGTTTVSSELGSCARSQGDPGSTAASSAPWGSSDLICTHGGGTPTPLTSAGGTQTPLTSADGTQTPSASAGGCSAGLPVGAGAALTADGLALAAGALLLRRRKRTRR